MIPQQGFLHYTPEHCLVNGGFPLFWRKKPYFKWLQNGDLLRSPAQPRQIAPDGGARKSVPDCPPPRLALPPSHPGGKKTRPKRDARLGGLEAFQPRPSEKEMARAHERTPFGGPLFLCSVTRVTEGPALFEACNPLAKFAESWGGRNTAVTVKTKSP